MTAFALSNNEVLSLPEPGNDPYENANRTAIGVFNLLGARITRITDRSVFAEIQPDVFICAALRTYGVKRGKIHWTPFYTNQTFGASGCYLAADRPIEKQARDIRRRVYPDAIAYCKAQREKLRTTKDAELVGELRLSQLEAVMGTLQELDSKIITSDHSLRISKYELQHPQFPIYASITVRNWHCFLMIAKLLAEDAHLSK